MIPVTVFTYVHSCRPGMIPGETVSVSAYTQAGGRFVSIQFEHDPDCRVMLVAAARELAHMLLDAAESTDHRGEPVEIDETGVKS